MFIFVVAYHRIAGQTSVLAFSVRVLSKEICIVLLSLSENEGKSEIISTGRRHPNKNSKTNDFVLKYSVDVVTLNQ